MTAPRRPVHAARLGLLGHVRKGITAAPPGSAEGGLTVTDIMAAHDELLSRGMELIEGLYEAIT